MSARSEEAQYNWATFRKTKGAVKLHLLLDHDGYLPVFAHLTEGRVHEMIVAKSLNFPKGTVVVIDRGYIGLQTLRPLDQSWGFFSVTRLKDNANYWHFEDRPVPKSSNVLKDQLIQLNPITAGAPCREDLRLVTVWDERNQCEVKLLTNQLEFAARTIADIYRERWQIELFFKALKQNLKIKTFVGTSANAVRIQIWTALIAILLLKILQFKSTFGWAQILSKGVRATLVLVNRNLVVGWSGFGPARDEDCDPILVAELHGIYLLPEYWSMGYGKQLYRATETHSSQGSVENLPIWVFEKNTRARSFYEAVGYRIAPFLPTYL